MRRRPSAWEISTNIIVAVRIPFAQFQSCRISSIDAVVSQSWLVMCWRFCAISSACSVWIKVTLSNRNSRNLPNLALRWQTFCWVWKGIFLMCSYQALPRMQQTHNYVRSSVRTLQTFQTSEPTWRRTLKHHKLMLVTKRNIPNKGFENIPFNFKLSSFPSCIIPLLNWLNS